MQPFTFRHSLAPAIAALWGLAMGISPTAAAEAPDIPLSNVPAGCFAMGSDNSPASQPVHLVCLQAFAIGTFEITQGQWQAVMGNNPAVNRTGPEYPVENVSFAEVQEFIRRLNQLTGRNYRLPTEAEWEYACRSGGKMQTFCGGGDLDSLGWHDGNSGGASHPVGTKRPNDLGIHDMSGNVWEWTADWYAPYPPATNTVEFAPTGPPTGKVKVTRGGSWSCGFSLHQSTEREGRLPEQRRADLGFRILLPAN